jgi:hypothetical protein
MHQSATRWILRMLGMRVGIQGDISRVTPEEWGVIRGQRGRRSGPDHQLQPSALELQDLA